jgi:hypothetical protein
MERVLKKARYKLTHAWRSGNFNLVQYEDVFKSVCQARPHLKRLRVAFPDNGTIPYDHDERSLNDEEFLRFYYVSIMPHGNICIWPDPWWTNRHPWQLPCTRITTRHYPFHVLWRNGRESENESLIALKFMKTSW